MKPPFSVAVANRSQWPKALAAPIASKSSASTTRILMARTSTTIPTSSRWALSLVFCFRFQVLGRVSLLPVLLVPFGVAVLWFLVPGRFHGLSALLFWARKKKKRHGNRGPRCELVTEIGQLRNRNSFSWLSISFFFNKKTVPTKQQPQQLAYNSQLLVQISFKVTVNTIGNGWKSQTGTRFDVENNWKTR